MNIRLVIRGFVGAKILFEDRVNVTEDQLEDLLPRMAETHAAAMASCELHMLEFEFLDEPDLNERFFRIGTDPAGMVMPVEIDLTKLREK